VKSRFQVAPVEQRTHNGRVFASKREMARFVELELLERAGAISNLEYQPRFPVTINGQKFCTYTADAAYFENGERVVEDSKSTGTAKDAAYKLRKKAAELFHGIKVLEIIR